MTGVEFIEDGHIYRLDGREVPSVTQVLEPYTGLEFVDRHTLALAQEFGTNVHLACHLYDMGELDESSLDPALVPYLEGWKRFLADSGAIVILSEYRTASRKHRYAGTFDKVLVWGKTKRMVDLKSGTVLPRTVGPQTAAYVEAFAEETGERIRARSCIHLPGAGKYSSHTLKDPRDWTLFRSALNWHHYLNRRAA